MENTMFSMLPPEVKQANSIIVANNAKVKALAEQIQVIRKSPDYLNAVAVMQKEGKALREKLQAEVNAQLAILKVLKPARTASAKAYTFTRNGDNITITNEGKSITVPLSEVKYSTEFIGNAEGKSGKVQSIGITFQQGKSLVGQVLGK
jgi:hypothetical protein